MNYIIPYDTLRKAVILCTQKMMEDYPGWQNDPKLSEIEWDIEDGVRLRVEGRHNITFEK